MADYQIIADESVDYRIVTGLRAQGVSVYAVSEQKPSIKDEAVLAIAHDNGALLKTEDNDLGELVFRLQLPHCGILLIRITETPYKISAVIAAISEHYDEMINKFSVLNSNKLRIKEN